MECIKYEKDALPSIFWDNCFSTSLGLKNYSCHEISSTQENGVKQWLGKYELQVLMILKFMACGVLGACDLWGIGLVLLGKH